MSPYRSLFSKKSPARTVRRNKSGRKDAQVNLGLMQLEPRLVMAPNVLAPETTAANPFGFPAGVLNLSGALAVSVLDTPSPASTAPFQVTVASSAGTASVGNPANVTVTGDGTNSLQFQGSIADINAALGGLVYTNATASATNATITVTARDSSGTPLSDSRVIYVRVANSTVAPTITTALANVAYYAETTSVTEAAISFTVSDPQGSTGVTVTGTSSNTNLILNTDITIAGTYPNFTVTLKHQANITGTALITLKVSDGTNFTTKSFNVSVAPTAQYYWDIVAGNGTAGITDGTGAAAKFNGPWQIAVDSANNLYVGDYNSGTIRKITPAGVVTTIAGSATVGYLDNANPLLAKFNKPRGIAVDNSGNVYVSEDGGYIRKIAYNSGSGTYGQVSTLASSLGSTTTSWGMLVVTPDGSTVYVAKVSDKKIYKIDTANNTGTALTAAFGAVPMGLSFDNNGNLLVREMTTGFTYQVTPAGVVTTLITALQYGNAQAIQLADGSYLSALNNTISRISPPNKAVVVGGGGTAGALGLGAAAGFGDIRSIVDAPNGFIYVSDWDATQNKIRVGKPAPSLFNPGQQSTLEGTRLAFSSANLAQLGAFANASDNSNVKLGLTYTLSAQNGTLDFNNVAVPNGVTVTFSADTRSVTLIGAETAINTYMLNFGYTPDANYINANASGAALASGAASPDVLSLTVTTANNLTNPITGSLNLLVKATNNNPRIVTALPDLVYIAESTTITESAIALTIADADTAATAFINNAASGARITATSDNPNLFTAATMAAAIGGTTAARTLTLKHEAGITGSATITITINDGTNQNVYTFQVTVTPSPYVLDVSTLAGRSSSTGATGYTDGTGTAATFTNPRGATADNRGLIYVQDGNLIRSISTGGLVTTLAGSTTTTTRVDGTGTAAGIVSIGSSTYAGMKVSPDNNWLYFINGGFLRKMGINPSDTANYKNVTSVLTLPTTTFPIASQPLKVGGGLVFSSDGNSIFLTPDPSGGAVKIQKIDLLNNTVSNFILDSNNAYTILPVWMIQGPNNTAILRTHPSSSFGSPGYNGGLISLNLATGVTTRLAQNPIDADTVNGSAAYNPITNEILVDTNSANPKILDAATGALKFNLPASNATNVYTNGVGSSFDATDATAISGGIYYLSQSGPSVTNAANIRAVKPGPGLFNPGTQSTPEGTRLAFSNANLAKLGALSNASLPVTYTLSAQYGTLDFNNVTAPVGVTVTFSADRRSVTLVGAETAINTYMLNFGYTPDAGYINANASGAALASGAASPDVLSLTVTTVNNLTNPITGSLNLLVKAANNTPRILTALPDLVYFADSTTTTETAIALTIADADTAATAFINNAASGARITATSDNPNLILPADIVLAIGGTGDARTFTVKHQANITGVANITITIADAQGNQSTYTFKVTVKTASSFYWDLLAGNGTAGITDGAGTAATFNQPSKMGVDAFSNLYVGDYNSGTIRKITPAGVVTTIAGSGTTGYLDNANPLLAKFSNPYAVTVDNNGNLYVSEAGGYIRKIAYNSGTGTYGPVSTVYNFNSQWGGIVVTPDGSTIYAGNRNQYKIYKIDTASNTGSVFVGSGAAGSLDGTGTSATFYRPNNLGFDNNGNILVRQDSDGKTRLVTPAGVVTTLISTANYIFGQAIQLRDGSYLSVRSIGAIARVFLPNRFSNVAGGGSAPAGAIGLGNDAGFGEIWSIVEAPNGLIYVSDYSATQNKIRVGRAAPTLLNPGMQSTLEGTRMTFSSANLAQLGALSNAVDASNNPLPITSYTLSAQFGTLDFNNVAVPAGVTVTFSADRKSVTLSGLDAAINTYMLNFGYTADAGYINANGTGAALASGAIAPDVLSFSVVTANNTNDPVTGSLNLVVKAANNTPRILTALPDKVYLVDSVTTTENAIDFTIADADTAAGSFSNTATTGARIAATCDNPNLILPADTALAIGGTTNARTFTVKHQPNITGVANITVTIVDAQGNQSTYTFKVTVKAAPAYYWGTLTTVAQGAQITYDSNGDLIALNWNLGTVWRITPQGATTLLKSGFSYPQGLAIDANKNLYVTDSTGNLYKVPYISATNTYGAATVLVSGLGAGEILISPDGTTIYAGLMVQIKKINIATGAVSVLAGSGSTGTADGTGLNATFNYSRYLAWDNNGNILVAQANLQVRQVTLAGVVTTLAAFASAPSLYSHQNSIVQTRDGNYVGMVSVPVVRVSTPDGSSVAVSGSGTIADGYGRAGVLVSARGSVTTPDGKVYISDVGSSSIRVGTLYPSLLNPGTQSTLDGVRLAFSSANLAQLGAFANDTDMSFVRLPITYTLSAQFGTLDFNNVAVPAGVTVTFSADRKSVTLSGLEAAINTYMLNFGYTPDANYINANLSGGALASGAVPPDVLSFSVVTANNTNNPVTGSLNLLVKAADNKPKIVTALPDRQYYVENATATETAITFTIADADTATFTNNATSGARITVTSDNPNLILPADMATAIGGTGINRTFTVKHQANITGVANVTITINDGTNQNIYTFKVTVVPTPSYYWNILAGSSAGTAGTTNATGTSASFSAPSGLVKDSQGNYFVTDTSNNLIRKITPQGVVTTFAGFGGVGDFLDGTGTAAKFNQPQGLAIDSSDNLYVADYNNNRIRKITPSGVVTTIAGTGASSSLDGAALSATMRGPTGIAVDSTGTVYWADKITSIIRKLQGGQVTTIAGSSGLTGTTDGTGGVARFNAPTFLTLNNAGNLVVNDATNLSYRQVTPAGVVTTLFNYTSGATAVGVDAQGNLYAGLSSNTLSLISSFDTTTIMGTGSGGSAIGVNTAATVGSTRQMVFLADGTIVIADNTRNNIRVGAPIPSLLNPGKQIVLADQLLTFDNAALEGLGIQSNGYPEPLSITLTVTKGVFSLSQTNGLTFATGDGTNDTTMTFTGSMANINSALTGLVYNFDEVTYPTIIADTLTISTPYTVGGVTSTISQVVPIQIVKPPVITAITAKLVNLGSAISAATFTVTDADTAANALTYTVTSSNTALVANSGLVRTPGTGATGTVAPANAANSLAITAVAGRTGTTTITISVFDGAVTTTSTFSVTVSPIVGAPDLIAASDTGTSTTDNLTSDTTPTFAVSIGGSSGIQIGDVVAIYNGTTKIGEAVVTAADIAAGSIQVTTSALADGNYSNITSSVIFGTTRGAISAPLSPALVIDATAPSANGLPDLTSASDSGASSTDNITNNTTPSFTIPISGSGAIIGDKVELYSGTTLIGTVTLIASNIAGGSATVVVSPALAAGTYPDIKYRLVDTVGNASSFSGSMSPALVIDLGAPTLVTLNPADNATNLVPPTTLVMTLSEAISKGTGSIVIKKTSDNSVVETFNVATSGRVMVSNSTVTITPSVMLAYGTGYYVTVANTALLDLAGNAYAGLSQAGDWNFTTLSVPTGVDLVAASDTGASVTDNVTNLSAIDLDVGLGGGTAVGDVIKLYDGLTMVGTITVDSTMLAAGKVTFSLTGQTDGVHSYSSTLSSGGVESIATAALAVTIDSVAPSSPTLVLDPASDTGIQGDGKTSDNTPTLSGTAGPGATVRLFIDGSSSPVTVVADSSGKWTYTPPSPLADGPHSVVATQSDLAGNTSGNSTPLLFTIDSTPPAPTAFSPADNATNISPPTSISVTFNEPIVRGSFGSITIWDDTTNTSLVIPASSSQISISGSVLTITPTTPFVSSTSYHVEIGLGMIRDANANLYAGISNATDWNFTTNNAPASPALDLQAASDTGFSNTDNKTGLTTLAFDVKVPAGAVAGDIVRVYDGQTLVRTIALLAADVTAGTVVATLTGVTAGSHSYTSTLERVLDGQFSNPSAALVVEVSTTQPATPVINPLGPTNDSTPTINGTAPANSKVDIYDANNNLIGTANADANGNWSFTPFSPLPDGSYQLNAVATDAFGNTSPASSPVNLVIDTTPPAKPVIVAVGPDNGPSTTDQITSAKILTLTGTGEANSVVAVYDNGVLLGTATANGSGQWTFTTIALQDGSNRFTADATDATGNRSVASDPYTIVIDSSAPTAPVINPLPSPNPDNTPILSGKGEPGGTVTVYDSGNAIGSAVVDANGDWTFTPSSPLSDGTHNFTADQKDAAGNTSPTSNQVNATIDSTPPAAPAITPLQGPTNDSTPAIIGTAEPNSTVKIYEGTTLLGTVTADGSGNWTFTPTTPLADGTHDLRVSATDAAGNVSPMSGKVAVVVDTVAPSSTLVSPANGTTDASIHANLVMTFSEPVVLGSTGVIQLRLADGTLVESFSVSSSRLSLSGSTLTIDPTANLAFATGYYVTIASGVVEDLAGNDYAGLANPTDWAFTTDALPIPPAPAGLDLQPGSDTGRSGSDDITSDNTPTLDIALNTSGLSVGDIVHLYDNGVEVGTATLTADDIAAGKVSITTSTLADGVHSLTAKVSDSNGTFSSDSAPLSVTVDTVPPVAPGTPDLAPSSDTGVSNTDNITSIKTPTFTGTGTPGDTISLYIDGVLAGTGVVDANGTYSITPSSPLADGVHSITSQATDAAGLTGPLSAPLSVTIDSTPPATPTSPADLLSSSDTGLSSTDNITADTTPDFRGGGLTPGQTVVLYVDGSPAGTATVDGNGNWTINASPALVDGSHTVTYLVKDEAGNSSGFASPMTVVVDTAVPAAPTALALDPASDTGLSLTDRITKDNTPTINGSGGTPGFLVTLLDASNNVIGTGLVGPDGAWSITPTSSLADDTYVFTAEYTSISGVTGPASDPLTVVIDTIAPTQPAAPTISPINPSATRGHTNSTSPVFTGAGFTPGNLVELFIDGSTTPAATAIVDAAGNYQVISSTLTDGAHSFAIKVTDAAGNTSPASPTTSLVIDSRLPGSPTTPDLTAATDTGRSNIDNVTSDNTPDFQGVVDATSNALPGDFVEIYSGTTLVGVGTVVIDSQTGDLVWKVTVGTTASGYTANTIPAGTVLADGVQAISARFVTPGGTASALSQALTVSVDTTSPSAPSGAPDLVPVSDSGSSSTDNLTNDTTPTLSGTGGVPGDTVNLYANGNLIGSAVVGPDGSYTVTPTNPLADGSYNFTTNYVDPAGNTSPFSAPLNNVVIDSTPPAVPPVPDLAASSDTGASNSDNITSDNTPTFQGFGTPGETIRIYVDGVLAGTTTVGGNGNWSITTNSLADGVRLVTSQAVDDAGNESAQSTPLAVTIDTTPPNAPIFTTPSGPTANAQPPISGTGEAGAVISLYDGTSLVGTAIVNADGSWTITPSAPLADGGHTFTATVTDGAGNTSPLSQPINVVIDTVNPIAPTVISVAQDTGTAGDRITSDNTLTITGTAEAGSTITVYDRSSGTPVAVGTAVVQPDGSYSVTTSVLADGQHPLSITSKDAAGNESQPTSINTWTIDATTPTSPTFGSVSQDTGNSTDKNTSDNTLTITGGAGSAEAGSTITVYDRSSGTPVAVGTAVVQPDGSYSVTTSVLADGQHPLSITAKDAAGNESQPTSIGMWTIDTTGQAAPSFGSVSQDTGTAGDSITSDNTLTITGGPGSAEAGSTITVYDRSSGTPVAVGTAVVQPDGSYSVTTSVLADGQHPLSITSKDAAGNESQPTGVGTWTIDTTGQAAPSFGSVSQDTGTAGDRITSDNTLTIAGGPGSAEAGSTITVYDTSSGSPVAVGTAVVQPDGSYSVTTSVLGDGQHPLSITATDVAGNESQPTSIGNWTIDTGAPSAPTFGSVSQDTGNSTDKNTSDNTLTITGGAGSAEAGSTITVYDRSSGTAVAVGTAVVQPDGSYSVTTSVLADGQHPLSITSKDTAGNESQPTGVGTWTIDTTGQAAPSFGSVSQDTGNSTDKNTSDNTLTITGGAGSAEAGSTITVYDRSSGTPVAVGTAVVQPDGSYSVTTSVLADGQHPLSITATDVAGNESQPTSIGNWTIDMGAPSAPTFGSVSQDTGTAGDRITSDNTLTITGGAGSAEAGSTITVYDRSSGTPVAVGTAVVQPDGSYSVTTSVLADGQHPLSITSKDAAGNESQPTGVGTWTIDMGAPSAPTFGSVSQDTGTAGDRITSDNTLTITGGAGSAEAGSTITVYDRSSGTPVAVGTAIVQPDGSYSVTTSVLGDGQHPLSITSKDTAGNESQPTGVGMWTIDTTGQAAPSFGSVSQDTGNSTDKNTSDNTLTITGGAGSAEAGSTITVYDRSSGTPVAVGTAVVQPDGSYSVTTSVLADGQHPLSITAKDAAGNESQPTGVGTWTIDTTGQAAPSFGSVSQDTGTAGDRITSDNTLTITGGAGSAEAGSTITVYDRSSGTAVAVGTAVVQPDGSYSVTTSVLADGQHPLSITAKDVAGNESQPTSIGTWTIDTTGQAAPSFGSVSQDTGTAGDRITSDNTLTITGGAGSAEAGSTITVYDRSSGTPVAVGTAVVQSDGSYSVTTSVLADGQHPLSITSKDAAGNESQSTSIGTWTIDTTGQAAPSFGSVSQDTGTAGDRITSDNTLTITGGPGSAEAGSTITVYDRSSGTPVVVGTAVVQPDGSYSVTTSVLADGQHPLSITSKDAAGNESQPTGVGTWTIDTTGQAAPSFGSVSQDTGTAGDRITSDNTLTITGGAGSAEAGSTITVYDRSSGTPVAVGTAVVQPNGSYSVTTSVLADGQHPLSITSKDAAGNESQPTSIGTWTIISFPTMSITPVKVNEASQYAIVRLSFNQAASAAITFTPSLTSGTGVVGTDTGSVIEYYTGSAWVSAAGGVTVPVGAMGVLLRVAIVNDMLNETSKIVNIATGPVANVLNPSGVATTITIKDNATGKLFSGANTTGTPDAPGTNGLPGQLDDDRPLTVNSISVNERSPFGVFTVTGVEGQLVFVKLRNPNAAGTMARQVASSGVATIGTDISTALEYFDGTTWVPYTPGSFVAIPADSDATPGEPATLLVRVAIINDNPYEGVERFVLVVNNAGRDSNTGTGTILDDGTGMIYLVTNTTGTPDAPGTPGYPASLDGDIPLVVTVTQADCSPGPQVMVVDPFTGSVVTQFPVFESTFRGGARVALGDVNGDDVDEIIVASGPGRTGEIRVYTKNGLELPAYRTQPFGPRYIGGVEVGAGDIDGNGTVDIVAVASIGAGTTSVFRVNPVAVDPVENVPYKSFIAFDRTARAGGSVAVADLNNDGRAEIIRGSGIGSAARVNVFDLTGTPKLVDSFVPFATLKKYTGGVSVSTTRFNVDATPDIVVAGGQGAGSVIEVYDGTINARIANARLDTARLAAFAQMASRNTGVFAAAVDLDGDGVADQFLTTQGEGGGNHGIRAVGRTGAVSDFPATNRSNLRIVTQVPKPNR